MRDANGQRPESGVALLSAILVLMLMSALLVGFIAHGQLRPGGERHQPRSDAGLRRGARRRREADGRSRPAVPGELRADRRPGERARGGGPPADLGNGHPATSRPDGRIRLRASSSTTSPAPNALGRLTATRTRRGCHQRQPDHRRRPYAGADRAHHARTGSTSTARTTGGAEVRMRRDDADGRHPGVPVRHLLGERPELLRRSELQLRRPRPHQPEPLPGAGRGHDAADERSRHRRRRDRPRATCRTARTRRSRPTAPAIRAPSASPAPPTARRSSPTAATWRSTEDSVVIASTPPVPPSLLTWVPGVGAAPGGGR